MGSRGNLQVNGAGRGCAQTARRAGGGCALATSAGGVSAQAVAAAGRVRAAIALAATVLALALAFMLAPQSAWAAGGTLTGGGHFRG